MEPPVKDWLPSQAPGFQIQKIPASLLKTGNYETHPQGLPSIQSALDLLEKIREFTEKDIKQAAASPQLKLKLATASTESEVLQAAKESLASRKEDTIFNKLGEIHELIASSFVKFRFPNNLFNGINKFGLDDLIRLDNYAFNLDHKSSWNWGNSSSISAMNKKMALATEDAIQQGYDPSQISNLVLNLGVFDTKTKNPFIRGNYTQLPPALSWEFLTGDPYMVYYLRNHLLIQPSRGNLESSAKELVAIVQKENYLTIDAEGNVIIDSMWDI